MLLFSHRDENQGSHSDLKNEKAFSSQGKVREFSTDWKSQGKSHKILENSGNFRQIFYLLFLVIFKYTMYHLINWIKFSVKKENFKNILENGQKILEKSGEFCQSGKVGTMRTAK